MLISFLRNVTLVISFCFIFSTLSQHFSWREKSKYNRKYKLATSLLFSILSLSMMLDPFVYNELIFDLRSIPIYFIAFTMGWKWGILTALGPLIYRLYLGGLGLTVGIISEIILPFLIGAIAHKVIKSRGIFELIKVKKLLMVYQLNTIARGFLFTFLVDIPLRLSFIININFILFSALTLVSIAYVFNNATKKYIAEEKLKASEERYRKLVEIVPDGLSIEHNGKFIYANENLAKILGQDGAINLIGKEINLFYQNSSDINEIVNDRINKVLKGESVAFIEGEIIRHDGKRLDIEVAAAPFIEKNQQYIFKITRDITMQKKAAKTNKLLKETIEMDRLKTEFFSNISHELKTPLNIILGTIQLANISNEQDLIYGNFEKHIKIMKQNCYRLLRLINNLIDITRLESGFLQMQIRNYDIIQVVEDITLSVAKYVEDNQIRLTFDTELEEKYIACDADKIERILLNLLSNAIKFTNPGGEIFVNILNREEYIEISVRDTGIGIPKDNLNTIFQRFRQVDSSLSRNLEGSGIGLSLVKSLVEAQGGEISVTSQLEKGSEFIIKLPVVLVDEENTAYSEVAATNGTTKVERVTIEFSDIYP
ncbi:sensor histidine kinase [Alkaliphilus transvaalensis]|uniref:sensor histidine kinase n=1 Tax=Alkaliphilus transvaalensis TaxID=114628 RepID=UPI000685365A|nr:ATP-binding protein [Alkaliphilus transvaalensis]